MTRAGALLLFAIAVYRAATQSLTVDEATTYINYVQHDWNGIFHGPFDANNHILYSILELLCTQVFGIAELSLRLPALLGAALFLWSVVRLCESLITGVWFQLLALVIIAGNPITLDFMVAARGYGLALGLLAFALTQLLDNRTLIASIALGLSVAANLIFVVPAIAAIIAKRQWKLIPLATLIPLVLWWLPFQDYDRTAFYYGAPDLHEFSESLVNATFLHDIVRGDPFGNWPTIDFFRGRILPLLALAIVISAAFWKRTHEKLAFVIAVFALTCFGFWLAHVALGVVYPRERTGLAIIFLFLLTWTCAVAAWWHQNQQTRRFLAFPSLLLAAVFVMQFAGQFDPHYFGTWRMNWKVNEAMSQLRPKHGKLRTHWIYHTCAEYYRLRWNMQFEPLNREPDKFELNNADYFILILRTDEDIAATGLRVLYRDAVTGTTLLEK